MAHGHDVLHMMEGNSYTTKESLVKAIIEKFGAEERFHTCSAEGMTAEELVDFLAHATSLSLQMKMLSR